VIGTLESGAVDDPPQRQTRASMQAQVAPREELVAGPPDDEVLSQQTNRERAATRELLHSSDGVPIVDEHGVIEQRQILLNRPSCSSR
jgi:hypothetical protein